MSVVQKADYGTEARGRDGRARADARGRAPRGFKVELVGGVVGRVCEVVDEEKGSD